MTNKHVLLEKVSISLMSWKYFIHNMKKYVYIKSNLCEIRKHLHTSHVLVPDLNKMFYPPFLLF